MCCRQTCWKLVRLGVEFRLLLGKLSCFVGCCKFINRWKNFARYFTLSFTHLFMHYSAFFLSHCPRSSARLELVARLGKLPQKDCVNIGAGAAGFRNLVANSCEHFCLTKGFGGTSIALSSPDVPLLFPAFFGERAQLRDRLLFIVFKLLKVQNILDEQNLRCATVFLARSYFLLSFWHIFLQHQSSRRSFEFAAECFANELLVAALGELLVAERGRLQVKTLNNSGAKDVELVPLVSFVWETRCASTRAVRKKVRGQQQER
eukprot:INCI5941.28.p1 GENE.INCI5941.28~~INCI5941.28.p1  ORF type:complete len:262 (+),score=28.69 INCI5941.28:985-1770(+)